MDSTPAPDDLTRIGDVLLALFALSLSVSLEQWERAVARALGELTGSDEVLLLLQGGQAVGPLSDGVSAEMIRSALRAPNAPAILDGSGHSPYRVQAWCRPVPTAALLAQGVHDAIASDPADGHAYEAVGLTAELGLPGVFATAICRFSPHRDAPETQRRMELLRTLLPAFATAARVRTSATGTRKLAARLLDASGASALLFTADGEQLHETSALTRVLGGDPDADAVRQEMTRAVRAFVTERFHALPDGGDHGPLASDVRPIETAHGRYALRCCEIPAEVPGQPALVAAMLEVAAAPRSGDPLAGAASTLRTRYGLTTRELDVARLLLAGKPNTEVARHLGISEFTARRHTEHVLEKLGVRSRAEVPAVLHPHLERPPRRIDP